MSEKFPARRVSSTDLRKQLGHWLDEVSDGKKVVVSRRGKPVATVEATQGVLPLGGVDRMTKDQEELAEVAKDLESYDLGRLIGIARQMIEENIKMKAKC